MTLRDSKIVDIISYDTVYGSMTMWRDCDYMTSVQPWHVYNMITTKLWHGYSTITAWLWYNYTVLCLKMAPFIF